MMRSLRITTPAALENNAYRALQASDGAETLAMFMEHRDFIEASSHPKAPQTSQGVMNGHIGFVPQTE
jgi:hypothetical protein